MKLEHPQLVELLQRAYSAEMAAAFAYVGHANSLSDKSEKIAIKQIEDDEWSHRGHVLAIMRRHGVPILRWYEIKFAVLGRVIGFSCHIIGWFMPFFSTRWASREKKHELYFLEQLKGSRWLPFFEKVFSWGCRLRNQTSTASARN